MKHGQWFCCNLLIKEMLFFDWLQNQKKDGELAARQIPLHKTPLFTNVHNAFQQDPAVLGSFEDRNLPALHERLRCCHGDQQGCEPYPCHGTKCRWWLMAVGGIDAANGAQSLSRDNQDRLRSVVRCKTIGGVISRYSPIISPWFVVVFVVSKVDSNLAQAIRSRLNQWPRSVSCATGWCQGPASVLWLKPAQITPWFAAIDLN